MKSIHGKVEAVFVNQQEQKVSEVRTRIYSSLEGIEGDKHYGFVRETGGSREAEIFCRPKNDKRIRVANWRQWSAVSLEEMIDLAEKLELSEDWSTAFRLASLLGANACISGIPHFSSVTPTSILAFPSDSLWMVISENLPCLHPGYSIEAEFPKIRASQFPKAAMGIRGLVGSVLLSGEVNTGDTVELRLR